MWGVGGERGGDRKDREQDKWRAARVRVAIN